MTGIQDFLTYRSLSQLCLSPDETQAVFVVQKPALEGNRYQKELWACRLETGTCRRLLEDGELGGSFLWEDGQTLLYAAGAKTEADGEGRPEAGSPEETVCRRLCLETGERKDAFTLPAHTREIWDAGGGWYLFRREERLTQEEYPQELAFLADYAGEFETVDEIPLWDNGRGFVSGKRCSLCVAAAGGGKGEAGGTAASPAIRLTPPQMTVDRVVQREEGLYFTARTYRGQNTEPGIYFLAAEAVREAAKASAPLVCLVEEGVYRISHFDAGALTESGREIFFTAQDKRAQCMTDDHGFYRAVGGAIRKLPVLEASVFDTVSSDCLYGENPEFAVQDGRIYYLATEGWDSFVKWADAEGRGGRLTPPGGSVNGFALLRGGRGLCLTGLRGLKLQELYLCREGRLRRLTALNEDCLQAGQAIEPETFTFRNHGFDVNYVVLPPAGFQPTDPAGTYPAILYIHGGAKVLYSRVFFHEMQYLASQGYFVVYGNPHGSDGQGSEFARLLGHYGEKDYDDLMKAMDEALARYPQIDPARLGVAGGSYGGIMTNWIVGHTNRFCCAVAQRSICSMLSTFGTADNGFNFVKEQMDGDLWDGFEKLWRQSPLAYANNCQTPLLLIHSDEDYRCHYTEAVQMFTALRYLGVETKLCLIRGENHSLSRCGRPVQRIKRLYEIVCWFNAHLKTGEAAKHG